MSPGPFSDERLISLETVTGPVSGFVQESELAELSGKWVVRAVVQRVHEAALDVWIKGSFFTTNGMATVPREMMLAA